MEPSLYRPPGVSQSPEPGTEQVVFCGDRYTFGLRLDRPVKGRAWVRTNLGAGGIARREIINRVEKNDLKLDEAWRDIEMRQDDDRSFSLVLPLHETGFFQAKCFFVPETGSRPVWPDGDNVILNCEPAGTCCANIIYNAFVRQFGPAKHLGSLDRSLAPVVETLDEKGYTVIPASGKFRDLVAELDFIFSELGCRALHLLPVHPTPTTYARMGRFGSPYAALNFTDVDPALALFDPAATPLEQFMELVDAVHFHNGYLILDIAINHTGWAAAIHETHPEWLVRGEDGKIKAPGAWGVVWADLTKLDYTHTGLWEYMADIFLLWCHRGVDGFRCDAGYMIPTEAWEYMVAKVREEYPDALFFLEGLGGPLSATREILGRANFNWAYSELFQQYSRDEITRYLAFSNHLSETCGHLIHFAETHDNNRLAAVSPTYAAMRTALSALFSVCGGFGFANGVEWFAREKINVHESPGLNWGADDNQVDRICRLNRLLRRHPAFFSGTRLSLIQRNTDECLVLLRRHPGTGKRLLILVNLDCEKPGTASWKPSEAGMVCPLFVDLLTGDTASPVLQDDEACFRLAPGQVMALSPDPGDPDLLAGTRTAHGFPARVLDQKRRARVLGIYTAYTGYADCRDLDMDDAVRQYSRNPVAFIRSLNRDSRESRVIPLDVDRDLNRQVMIPPGYFLLVRSGTGFRAEILEKTGSGHRSLGYEEGLPDADARAWYAVFPPREVKKQHKACTLNLRLLAPGNRRTETAHLMFLAPFDTLRLRTVFSRKEILKHAGLKLLGTTRTGGMMRASARWGHLDSRYDGLLGANLDPHTPENRWMVLARYRIWAVFQGYSRELALDCLETVRFSFDGAGQWRFHVPTSEGKFYVLVLTLSMARDTNRVSLGIQRLRSDGSRFLADGQPVTLIVRPDIEDRSFHETVKAFQGPETVWPAAVSYEDAGFRFALCRGRFLTVTLPGSRFVREPEWHYMVPRPLEAQRGLDDASDLFSPGYFTLDFRGGDAAVLDARIPEKGDADTADPPCPLAPPEFDRALFLEAALNAGLDAFLVDRGGDKSVIAGYPWFLDWGRDSLIFCRCLIQLGRLADAMAVLRLFGRFENQGTLPNMICGTDAANIETSDAPLWFFACCRDMLEKTGDKGFLDQDLDGRTLMQVLVSMAGAMIRGTPTGVREDPDTGLLYSPSHFTWMDTNFPAGTPRRGYPVEIQALWFNALDFLAGLGADPGLRQGKDTDGPSDGEPGPHPGRYWQARAQKVRQSVKALFWNQAAGFFSDCLHGEGPAREARPDDALRPNQLMLFSLNVIREPEMAVPALETCLELLVPGAIRSLADRVLANPLRIAYNNELLRDPHHPYSGTYQGDEDRERKPAYHNGTAWTWPFPVFCEAWAAVFGEASHATCLAWLGSCHGLLRSGAAGYLPEILDGDYPHTPRGCDAQAWGVSEAARVVNKLS